jgi:hypothetical protein
MNKIDNLNPHQVNAYARLLAAEAALAAAAPETALMILAKTVKVKGSRDGTWQGDKDGNDFDGCAAVVYADLTGDRPVFHVVPAAWMRADVKRLHALAYPTGHRVNNDDSPHHLVEPGHIAQWGPDWRAWIGWTPEG